MSYVAHDIGTIPTIGFEWYLIFFEGMFSNALQREIHENFEILGNKVGRGVLVVRGYDPEKFNESAYEAFADLKPEERPEWTSALNPPALVIMNTAPVIAMKSVEQLRQAKVMVFPLETIYKERESITGFLGELLSALRDADAYEALETLNKPTLEKKWGWLTKYFSMSPGFFGFGVKLDRVMDDLLFKRDPPQSFA
jgi:hypothetical protein